MGRGGWLLGLALFSGRAFAQEPAADLRIGRARELLVQARTIDDQAGLLDERTDKLGQGILRKRVDVRELRDRAKAAAADQRAGVVAQAENMEAEVVIDEAEQKRLRTRAEELRKTARQMRAEALREARGEGAKKLTDKEEAPKAPPFHWSFDRVPPALPGKVPSLSFDLRSPVSTAGDNADCATPFVYNREGIKLFRRECLGTATPPRDPCDPPFDIGTADGRKRFKVECFEGALSAAKTCDPPFVIDAEGNRRTKEACAFDTRR